MNCAFQQRLLRYLALGFAEDELDWAAHDKHYHHGHFDSKTMTCKARQKSEKGDKADIIPRPDGQTAAVHSPFAVQTAGERYGKYKSVVDDARVRLGNRLLPDDTPVSTLGAYYGKWRDMVKGIREGDENAVREAGSRMAARLPPDAVLVPMPGRNGDTKAMRRLADEIAANAPGAVVNDVLLGSPHESSYEQKLRGEFPSIPPMVQDGPIPPNRPVFIVDNVVASGATAAQAVKALGGKPTVLAVSETMAGTAKKLFGEPSKEAKEIKQEPPKPRKAPKWVEDAPPCTIDKDEKGNEVVSCPFVPMSKSALDKRKRTLGFLRGTKANNISFDNKGVGEYQGSRYFKLLETKSNYGLQGEEKDQVREDASLRGEGHVPGLKSNSANSVPNGALPVNVGKIVARGVHEAISKGQHLDTGDTNRIAKILEESKVVSKIVDSNGEPKPLLHYTEGDFDFKDYRFKDNGVHKTGTIWFCEDEGYVEFLPFGSTPKKMWGFLDIKNPLDRRDARGVAQDSIALPEASFHPSAFQEYLAHGTSPTRNEGK